MLNNVSNNDVKILTIKQFICIFSSYFLPSVISFSLSLWKSFFPFLFIFERQR